MGRIEELISYGRKHKCSDIHLTYGLEPIVRCNGRLVTLKGYGIMEDSVLEDCKRELLEHRAASSASLEDIDLCYEAEDFSRNRVNIYRQQKHIAIAIRLLNEHIPSLEELNLPPIWKELTSLNQGLVLVTGPTGSGKSTTLAACINEINQTMDKHIVTIEDPVEYRHIHNRSMVNQREIGADAISFSSALESALREDADVIMVGELKDLETISAAITAAENGHLVFSTLHTIGAGATIERIVDVFPPYQQQQIRTQLASVLKAVISQQLVPVSDESGRMVAQEIFIVNEEAADFIREDKCRQLDTVLQKSKENGMQSMEDHLYTLAQQKLITAETALHYAIDKAALSQKL